MPRIKSIYPAKLHFQQEAFISCPWCEKEKAFSVGHVLSKGDTIFGPWFCDVCGHSITGKVLSGAIFIDKAPGKRVDMATLLKMRTDPAKGLYLIVKDSRYENDPETHDESDDQDHQQYYFEEHICPSNYFPKVIEVLTEDNGVIDPDEHGLFTHMASIHYSELNSTGMNTSNMIKDLWSLRGKEKPSK